MSGNIASQILLCDTANDLAEKLSALVKDDFILLADENTAAKCLPLLQKHFPIDSKDIMIIPPGESSKSIATAESIWATMLQMNLSRKSTLICLGGGVVTDIGGFCASTYKRGVQFINIPTSLLAMVDAAIGGKTGINLNKLKNMVGTFHLPEGILLFPEFLETLPRNEILNGWAEMIKHALIADADQWDKLKLLQKLDTPSTEMIFRSAMLKQNAIQKDFKETDYRKILNFGHTIGHALENIYVSENKMLGHGIAVAAGMKIEAHICNQLELLGNLDFHVISNFIDLHFPKVHFSPDAYHQIIFAARADKKSTTENILMAGISSPGNAIPSIPIEEKHILNALDYYLTANI